MKRIAVFVLSVLFFTSANATEYIAMVDEYRAVAEIQQPPQYELVVNRSTYMMDVVVDGQVVDTRRVIVGKPGRSTPLLETEFINIEVNPTWDVPKSLTDDMVRKFKGKKDPIAYIKRNKYYFVGPDGNHIKPEDIDWTTIPDTGPYEFKVKQEPGPLNMLGPVMFVLKGSNGVQMHGTANPELFDRETRKFSSGCIRVDGAETLAAAILGKTPDEFERYRRELGNKWLRLPAPVKVRVVE
jgi:murein L,D-transpeptidase YcbB/YkuD